MHNTKRYSPEVRERAVRLVLEHERDHESQWAAIMSLAALTQAELHAVAVKLNTRPRKTLGYDMPAERMAALLH